MTKQMHHLAVKQIGKNWSIEHVDHGYPGGSYFFVIDSAGKDLLKLSLENHLPGFSQYAHWTTAGMSWQQQVLVYITDIKKDQLFVIHPWWGSRLVLSLNSLQVLPFEQHANALISFEKNLVLKELKKRQDNISTTAIYGYLSSCIHLAGTLKIEEAIPILKELEELSTCDATVFGAFSYEESRQRRLIQIALRRLGEAPRCYPAISFLEDFPQMPPVNGETRHKNLAQVKKSISLKTVYDQLGAPDYIENAKEGVAWRYDIDAQEPYTVLMWLTENKDTVAKIIKYSPPFWIGPQLFPSPNHSLLWHDCATVFAYTEELEDGSFVGDQIEL